MKRLLLTLTALLLIAPQLLAATPAGSYDEELYGLNKPANRIKHQVDINAGFIAGGKLKTKNFGKIKTNLARPFVDVTYGARFNQFLFAGIGTGVQYAYGECNLIHLFDVASPDRWGAVTIPLFASIKGYFPVSRLVAPYIGLSIGHAFIATSNFSQEGYGKLKGGLYCKFGAGVTVGKFNVSLGLASQSMKWIDAKGDVMFSAGNNAAYIEVGVKF
ncbi:MAG: hypothetical protein IKA81_03445 [Alistipes sp.]|nr:hypothetical protein [Alistipes sp.]